MRIITKIHLYVYAERNPETRVHIDSWIAEVEKASWKSSNEVKLQDRNASPVGNRRVVFNIKGNDHRLIVAMAYKMQTVYIKFIGTHKQYDTVDAETVTLEN